MTHPAFLLLPLILMAALPADAAELVRSYRYYPVGGASLAEIEADLRELGPPVANTGQRHPGSTVVSFETQIEYDASAGQRCRIASARVRVTARITLPQWRRPASAGQDTRILWNTLAADIRRHEDHHAEIARRYAARLETDLRALGPARDCTRLANAVDRTKNRVFAEHDREQTRFDRSEGRNFAARMERLLRYRLERIERGELRE